MSPLVRDIFYDRPNRYMSLARGITVGQAFKLREAALREALHSFRPDLIFVDHGPAGAERELLPLLDDVAACRPSGRPRLVLGLRDIYGEERWTIDDWTRLGAGDVLPLYDLILVFGDPAITTTARELNLDGKYPERVEHTGYLGQNTAQKRRRAKDGEPPLILVTPGGGHDGAGFIATFVRFLEQAENLSDFRARIVTGPFLSRSQFADLTRRCGGLGSTTIVRSTRRIDRLLSEASGVICMAGYNSMVEVICSRVPALVIPRQSPSREQVLRAERLSAPGGLRWCMPGSRSVEAIEAFVGDVAGDCAEPAQQTVDLGGIRRSVKKIESLLV